MQDQWRITSPKSTHWREVHCWEVACPHYLLGWKTVLPIRDEANIRYIKSLNLRYREERNDPLLVTFVFEPGQECFKGRLGQHQVPLDRPQHFTLTRHGDRRMMEWERWINDMDRDLRETKRIREG